MPVAAATSGGDIERGVPVTPKVGRLRLEEALKTYSTITGPINRRSIDVVQRRITKHLSPFFGGRRMANINTTDVRQFIANRQADTVLVRKARRLKLKDEWVTTPEERRQVSNGEINRELTILKRAFSLAIQAGKLMTKPYIPC